MNNNDSNMTIDDAISNSNFGFTIQNWLRDFVKSQPSHRMSSYYDRPWSKSHAPWSLEKMQRDIEQFNRFSEYTNAIEVSKKMLQNGILGKSIFTREPIQLINRFRVRSLCI
jgi:hypothetical protein